MSKFKTVYLPIKVPAGDFCWDYAESCICNHFDNEGGHPTCDLRFSLDRDKDGNGVRKPNDCLNLQEAKVYVIILTLKGDLEVVRMVKGIYTKADKAQREAQKMLKFFQSKRGQECLKLIDITPEISIEEREIE